MGAFKYLKPIVFLGLGGGLLWIAFKGLNFSDFKNTLLTIPLYWVFCSMLLGYLAFVFRGLRWKLLIKPMGFEPRNRDLIHSIAFGYLFNSFIPRSGELVRCTALNKVTRIPVSKLFGHVLLERLIDFILLAICILISIILNYNDFMQFAQLITLPVNLLYYTLLFICLTGILFINRAKILRPSQIDKINMFFQGIKTGFISIKNMPNKVLFFLYTLLIWFCYLFMTVVCFYCFHETKDLNLGQGIFIMVAGGLGMVIPTPTGIGSYHYLVIQALSVVNISREIAQFFALIVHSSQAIMIIISGFFAMIALYYRKTQN
tara:strand:- start:1635 stop:2588 length:954 start_codon:yes stop_codon:yes gene_type:complete